MDHGTVPPTTDQTEEGADDHERARREPYATEGTPGDDPLGVGDHVGVRAWVASLFSR